MVIAIVDGLLQWTDVQVQEMQPHRVQTDLIHMDVAGRHRFVATLQAIVVVGAIRPFTEMLNDIDEVLAEAFCTNWEPIDIGARLFVRRIRFQLLEVFTVDVTIFPVLLIGFQHVEIGMHQCGVKLLRVNQVTIGFLIEDVQEDLLEISFFFD